MDDRGGHRFGEHADPATSDTLADFDEVETSVGSPRADGGTRREAPADGPQARGPADAPAPSHPRPSLRESKDDTVHGTADDKPKATVPAKKGGRKRVVFLLVLLAAIAAGAYYGYGYWTVGRFMASTDDAYVGADTTILAAKVSGYIASVDVANNQQVKAGDVIARIDDGDYANKVESAKNRIVAQQAAIDRAGEQIRAAEASIGQAQAQLTSAQADLERANATYDRQQELAKSSFTSKQSLDNAKADRDRTAAAVESARAALNAANVNVDVIKAQRVEAQAALTDDRTQLAQAERDLSFTIVKAPVDGVVGNRAAQVGQYVQPGTRLAAIVPLDGVYVDANFKETQLRRLVPGQTVTIEVDAYPDRHFTGTVDSVAPASGSVFSLLPPENATGNFTKIVQRVPVRVHLSADDLKLGILRPGMSVTAIVDTRTAPAKDASRS